MWAVLPTVSTGSVESGGASVGVSTTMVVLSGSPSRAANSCTVPTATIGLSSTARWASVDRPRP